MGSAAFLVVLLAAALPGQRAVLAVPAAGSVLQSGQLVEVRWTGVPASAREVELVLSVDGGRTYPLRLTEELAPKSGSFVWRVPSLLSEEASLALRIGIDGGETVCAPGATFRLRPDPTPGKVLLRWKSGEIWLGSDEESEETDSLSRLPPEGFCGAPERLTFLSRETSAAFPARFTGAGSSRRSSPILRTVLREACEIPRPASRATTPLTIPQRI